MNRAANAPSRLTDEQRDGLACVRCGLVEPPASAPVGGLDGCQVFACWPRCPAGGDGRRPSGADDEADVCPPPPGPGADPSQQPSGAPRRSQRLTHRLDAGPARP